MSMVLTEAKAIFEIHAVPFPLASMAYRSIGFVLRRRNFPASILSNRFTPILTVGGPAPCSLAWNHAFSPDVRLVELASSGRELSLHPSRQDVNTVMTE